MDDHLFISARYCGPPVSGNGGYTSGALAGLVPGARVGERSWRAVEVSLRRPPPLEVRIAVRERDGRVIATGDDDVTIAEAGLHDGGLAIVDPVSPAEARDAQGRYAGLTDHPFPSCFGCGTARAEGDGLRLFPGSVADQDGAARVATAWTPHPGLADRSSATGGVGVAPLAVLWCALDCVGGWAFGLGGRPVVLARMRAQVEDLPRLGTPHVLMGMAMGEEGRKGFSVSALYDADGRLVGSAEHLWITVDPARFS